MDKVKVLLALVLAAVIAFVSAGCSSSVSQDEQSEAVEFYRTFVLEGTSLDPVEISRVYSELAEKDFEGQNANKVRDQMFARFDSINPEFFSKMHLTDSSYAEAGKTYSTILLMSLATGGQGVEVTMPLDAVTSYNDNELGQRVYEIDRTKITATVSESLALKVTRPNRNGLAPVRLIKEEGQWKVIADNNMLTEIGIPQSEKISGPSNP